MLSKHPLLNNSSGSLLHYNGGEVACFDTLQAYNAAYLLYNEAKIPYNAV